MAINANEKKALQKMWDNSKAPGSVDLPDGEYEFVIVKAKPVMGKSTAIKQVLEVTGGHSDYIGEHVDLWDRLESESNMGWFKKKASMLGITIPKEIELVLGDSDMEGSICQQLLGKKFAGAVVTKGDYVNIYCNRFIEDVELSDLSDGDAAEEDADQQAPTNGGHGKHDVEPEPEPENKNDPESDKVEEDDTVIFTSKGKELEGIVVELINDGEIARVKTDKGIFKVPCSKCEIQYDEGDDSEGATPEPEAEAEPEAEPEKKEAGSFPTPDEVAKLRMPALRKALNEAGLKPDDVAKVRELAMAVAGFLNEENYKPEVTQLRPLCKVFGIKQKKGTKPSVLINSIAKAVQKHFDN